MTSGACGIPVRGADLSGAARASLAVVTAVLVMGTLRLPQPFLAVLAACLLAGLPGGGFQVLAVRIGWAWLGAIAGAGILVGLPEQPWISLPVFLGVLVAGYHRAGTCHEHGAALLFCMGIAASFPAGVVVPVDGLMAAINHGSALTVGAGAVAGVVGAGRPVGPVVDHPSIPPSALRAVALSALGAVVLSQWTMPRGSVVMVVAAVVTADALGRVGSLSPAVFHRVVGALAGAAAGIAGLVMISNTTNNLAAYLALVGMVAWLCESAARKTATWADAFRQAAAAFVVVVTVFPRPVVTLDAAFDRGFAVVCGILVAAVSTVVTAATVGGRSGRKG